MAGDDARIWDVPHQYLLGDELLVSPVTEPGRDRGAVYLPAGEWVDLFTGERHMGPVVVERPVPLDEIPVYVRLPGSPALPAEWRSGGVSSARHGR